MLRAPDASQRFEDLYANGLKQFLTQAEHNPTPELFNDLEILTNRVAKIVAGLMILQPEKTTDRKLLVEIFRELMILESRIKEYYHPRESFLSVVQWFDLSKIATAISMATIHCTMVLDYSEPQ